MELKNFFALDDQGNALSAAKCSVYMRGTETLVSGLLAANGVPLTNPFVADQLGLIQFAAANGLYDVRVETDSRDYRIRAQFNDVSETVAVAEAAAERAEVARDVVHLSAGLKDDVAHGLATTVPGQNFTAPSLESNKYLTIYKNEAGAAVPVDSYPNAAALDVAIKNVRQDHSSDVLFSVADEGGFSKFTLTADGGFGTAEVHFGPEKIANDSFEMGAPGSGVDFSINDDAGFARLVLGEDGSLKTPAVQLGPDKVAIDGFEMRTSAPGVRFAVVDPSGFHAVHVGAHESLSGAPTPSAPSTVGGLAAIPTSGRQVIAHRGSTVGGIAPENSLDAYKLAARAGYKRVETDVIRTADGQFLIMHDDSINRTCRNAADYSVITGTVNALDKTMAELRANYVLTSAVPRFRRKIPTLDEFLGVCRDFGLYPVIELKYFGFTNAEIEAITNRAIEILGADGFAFCSFKLDYLDYVRSIFPKVELYYIYGSVNTAAIEHMVAMQPAALYASYSAYTAETVAEAHRRGVKVAAWTVPNNQFDNLLKLGFDEFATDTLAPPLAGQSIIYSDYSGAEFAAYATTGSLADGVVTLAQGQTLTFVPGRNVAVGFGAYYLSLDVRGALSVAATRLADSVVNAGDDFASYRWQAALYNESFTLTVTAGAGGCVIKDVQLAVAKF
ncbi:glycerophosphodiester phosphodiesterase [Pseudomonas sp. LB3P31]